MPRPPKPPKTIEYALVVMRRIDEDTNTVFTRFEVRTAREFQSFQYHLAIDARFNEGEHTLTITIGGVTVPADLMPGSGPAVGGTELANLKPGTYTITVKKAPRDVNTFTMTVTKAKVTVSEVSVTGRKFIEIGK